MAERIALTVNDKQVEAAEDCSVAAAVMESHARPFRLSVTGQPRGPLCGMGVCFECRLTVDGEPHQRTCLTPCRDGMRIQTANANADCAGQAEKLRTEKMPITDTDVVVIGSGPGGIAAACCAAEAGRRVAIVDDNPRAGGQIWRHDPLKPPPKLPAHWLARMRRLPIEAYSQTQILASLDATTLLAETRAGPMVVRFRKLILACGARERFLPFPGWTLPGVFGAGGLQALAKAGYSVGGRRIVVAGSGPLLLAVAAYLHANAAYIQIIAEQAPRGNLARFAGSLLWRQPAKMLEGIALRWQLRGVPYRTGCWPIRADGSDRLASVTLTDGARTWTEPCDSLACGFGLVPNLELPMLLGCAIDRGFVKVDDWQQTTVPGVFAVGELTGIGGLDKALVEGQIAGWAAADQPERGRALFRERTKMNRFVTLLDETFALRNELRHLADDATIVCRCEDVPLGALKRFTNWRDAKLQTRCGMGPCQGRICGPALEFLFGWTNDSVRPPIFPTALANLS